MNSPFSQFEILAKLARKVGGSLDTVIAMTGHKALELADHYSELDTDFQKEISLKVMEHIKDFKSSIDITDNNNNPNVIPLFRNS